MRFGKDFDLWPTMGGGGFQWSTFWGGGGGQKILWPSHPGPPPPPPVPPPLADAQLYGGSGGSLASLSKKSHLTLLKEVHPDLSKIPSSSEFHHRNSIIGRTSPRNQRNWTVVTVASSPAPSSEEHHQETKGIGLLSLLVAFTDSLF